MTDTITAPLEAEANYTEWKNWQAADFGQASEAEARYFNAEIGARVPGQAQSALLEIGFGNGALLGWARRRFATVAGVEQSGLLVERARAAGFDAYDTIAAFPAQPLYDVVVAMDVLEHLSSAQIEEMLREISLRLKPGGCFIARFPNGDSPFGRINQHGDITHVNAIGCMKMTYFAERSRLELEYIAAPAWVPQGSFKARMEQRWERGLRFVFERAIASLYLPHRMSFDMNYVTVLRKPAVTSDAAPLTAR